MWKIIQHCMSINFINLHLPYFPSLQWIVPIHMAADTSAVFMMQNNIGHSYVGEYQETYIPLMSTLQRTWLSYMETYILHVWTTYGNACNKHRIHLPVYHVFCTGNANYICCFSPLFHSTLMFDMVKDD